MSIDTLVGEKAINIKDLVVDMPKSPGTPFWEIGLDSENWAKIELKLKSYFFDEDWQRFYKLAGHLVAIYPERRTDKIFGKIDYSEISETLQSRIDNKRPDTDLRDISNVAGIKLLFPGKDVVSDTGVTPDQIIDHLNKKTQLSIDGADAIINYAFLFPDQLDKLRQTDFDEYLQLSSESTLNAIRLSSLAALKIAFPEAYHTQSNSFFDESRDWVLSLENQPDLFIKGAMYLKILAAEKAEMTDKGLLLTMPKSDALLDRQNARVPEQRKF